MLPSAGRRAPRRVPGSGPLRPGVSGASRAGPVSAAGHLRLTPRRASGAPGPRLLSVHLPPRGLWHRPALACGAETPACELSARLLQSFPRGPRRRAGDADPRCHRGSGTQAEPRAGPGRAWPPGRESSFMLSGCHQTGCPAQSMDHF